MALDQEAKQRAEKNELLGLAKTYLEQNDFAKAAETFKRASVHEVIGEVSYKRNIDDDRFGRITSFKVINALRNPVPHYSCVFQEIQAYLQGKLYDQAISAIEGYLKQWDIKKEEERGKKSLYKGGLYCLSSTGRHYELLVGEGVYSIAAELNYLCGIAYSAKNDPKLKKKIRSHFSKSHELCVKVFNDIFPQKWKTNDFLFELAKKFGFGAAIWFYLAQSMMFIKNGSYVFKAALLLKVTDFLYEKFCQADSQQKEEILWAYRNRFRSGARPVYALDLAVADEICTGAFLDKSKEYPLNICAAVRAYRSAKVGTASVQKREAVFALFSRSADLIHYAKSKNEMVSKFVQDMLVAQSEKKNECFLETTVLAKLEIISGLFVGDVNCAANILTSMKHNPAASAEIFIALASTKGCPEIFITTGLNTFLSNPHALDSFFSELRRRIEADGKNEMLKSVCQKAWDIVSKSGCHSHLKEQENIEVLKKYLGIVESSELARRSPSPSAPPAEIAVPKISAVEPMSRPDQAQPSAPPLSNDQSAEIERLRAELLQMQIAMKELQRENKRLKDERSFAKLCSTFSHRKNLGAPKNESRRPGVTRDGILDAKMH